MSKENTENMTLWDAVCETDPKYTKKVNQRGGFTAINAQYQLEKATEVWGPYGKDWGVRDLDWRMIEDGKGGAVEAILNAEFYYPGGSFPIGADLQYRPGNDTRKKLLTDLTTKALSKLGFDASIFKGDWDDNKYVAGPDATTSTASGSTKKAPQRKDTPVAEGDAPPRIELPERWEKKKIGFGKHKEETWEWLGSGGPDGDRLSYCEFLTSNDPRLGPDGTPWSSQPHMQKKLQQYEAALRCIEHMEGTESYLDAESTFEDLDGETPF